MWIYGRADRKCPSMLLMCLDCLLYTSTGFNRPECEEALQSAFDELKIDKVDVFITHLHSDHCGLVPKFAKKDSIIYSGETDGELMNFEAGNLYWAILDDMFLKFGFPKAEFGSCLLYTSSCNMHTDDLWHRQ